jgi:hypothetical protein
MHSMIDQPASQTSKIVDSVAVKLIARAAMIAAACSLPIAGWMINRGVSTIDEVSHKIDHVAYSALETNGTVKLIQQTQGQQQQIIADHEIRVRSLENIGRKVTPP